MLCDVLKRLRKHKNITQAELAEYLKISQSAVGMYESGKRMPDYDTMIAIADYYNVDIDYLYERTKKVPQHIPILGYVAAGIPIEAITDIIDYEEIDANMVRDGSEYFGLKIKGDSMEPMISNTDYVIVKRQPDCDSGDIAIVCVNGDEATCKRVMKQPNGILLVPINPSYETVFYSNREIEKIPIKILGIVVELRRKFTR